jgi:hypothetical protein
MAEQELYRAQVARAAIDQRCLGTPERVGAKNMRVQPDACNPLRNEASVLPRGHALSRTAPTREQKFAGLLAGRLQVGVNGLACLLG